MTQIVGDISVIICAYTNERRNELMAAVISVQQQTLLPREIIVVIDHNPNLFRHTQECMTDVLVVENTAAPGLSAARNSGVAVAMGQIIAFLDDDAVAAPDWLMFLYEGFSNPAVLGVGGMVTPYWSGSKPAWLPEEFYWVVGCTYRGIPQTASSIRNLIGTNMSFRHKVFDDVGGFRPNIGRIGALPISCEETELCIRTRQHWPQGIFLYLPQANVFHHVPSWRTGWRYFCLRCYTEGLSKSTVTRHVGVKDGLSSERTYVVHILVRGVVDKLSKAFFTHDLTELTQAGAIVLGLTMTTVGYTFGFSVSRVVNTRLVTAIGRKLQGRLAQ